MKTLVALLIFLILVSTFLDYENFRLIYVWESLYGSGSIIFLLMRLSQVGNLSTTNLHIKNMAFGGIFNFHTCWNTWSSSWITPSSNLAWYAERTENSPDPSHSHNHLSFALGWG